MHACAATIFIEYKIRLHDNDAHFRAKLRTRAAETRKFSDSVDRGIEFKCVTQRDCFASVLFQIVDYFADVDASARSDD